MLKSNDSCEIMDLEEREKKKVFNRSLESNRRLAAVKISTKINRKENVSKIAKTSVCLNKQPSSKSLMQLSCKRAHEKYKQVKWLL